MDTSEATLTRSAIKPHPLRPYYTPGLVPNYTSITTTNASSSTPSSLGLELPGSNAQQTFTEYARFAGLRFMTTAVLGPFETGKTLLQVQYLPHEDIEVVAPLATATPAAKVENPISDYYSSSEEEDEDDKFFSSNVHLRKANQGSRSNLPRYNSSYTVRSVYDDNARPQHQLAPIEGGILDAIRALINHSTEGWRSLLKGQYTGWLHGMLQLVLQPSVEGSLNDLFDLYDDTIPLIHLERIGPNLATLLASHVLVGVLLSPLEIARTRLIVQSSAPGVRSYSGLMNCLSSMKQNEGGLKGIYLSPNLVPTILYHFITPLVSSTAPLVIDRLFHISASDAPIAYGLAKLLLSTLEVLMTLPVETIRKRIQCQVKFKDGKPFNTCVATRPVRYTGFLDGMYKVMKEEGTSLKRKNHHGQESVEKKSSAWGVQALYKGFGIQCASNVLSSLVHTLNGIEDDLTK